jgi:GNAT superfamily N-acetyltransferase
MEIKFVHNLPLEQSLIFEEIYDENLQMDLEEKLELKDDGAEFIFMINGESGELIGETYFIPLDVFEGEEPDPLQPDEGLTSYFGKGLIYCYSTTILPKHQQKGFGKLLKAYLYGYVYAKGYKGSIAHAKAGASIKLNTYFGAEIVGEFENWYQTGITHYLYLKWF